MVLIKSTYPRVQFTSPRRGEVDLPTGRRKAPPDDKLRKSGEGALDQRETVTPHPSPLPTGEGAHLRCRYTSIQLIMHQEKQQRASAAALLRGTGDHFIGHLSWKRSWLSLTMVATVFSESAPSVSFTTSCR